MKKAAPNKNLITLDKAKEKLANFGYDKSRQDFIKSLTSRYKYDIRTKTTEEAPLNKDSMRNFISDNLFFQINKDEKEFNKFAGTIKSAKTGEIENMKKGHIGRLADMYKMAFGDVDHIINKAGEERRGHNKLKTLFNKIKKRRNLKLTASQLKDTNISYPTSQLGNIKAKDFESLKALKGNLFLPEPGMNNELVIAENSLNNNAPASVNSVIIPVANRIENAIEIANTIDIPIKKGRKRFAVVKQPEYIPIEDLNETISDLEDGQIDKRSIPNKLVENIKVPKVIKKTDKGPYRTISNIILKHDKLAGLVGFYDNNRNKGNKLMGMWEKISNNYRNGKINIDYSDDLSEIRNEMKKYTNYFDKPENLENEIADYPKKYIKDIVKSLNVKTSVGVNRFRPLISFLRSRFCPKKKRVNGKLEFKSEKDRRINEKYDYPKMPRFLFNQYMSKLGLKVMHKKIDLDYRGKEDKVLDASRAMEYASNITKCRYDSKSPIVDWLNSLSKEERKKLVEERNMMIERLKKNREYGVYVRAINMQNNGKLSAKMESFLKKLKSTKKAEYNQRLQRKLNPHIII